MDKPLRTASSLPLAVHRALVEAGYAPLSDYLERVRAEEGKPASADITANAAGGAEAKSPRRETGTKPDPSASG